MAEKMDAIRLRMLLKMKKWELMVKCLPVEVLTQVMLLEYEIEAFELEFIEELKRRGQ